MNWKRIAVLAVAALSAWGGPASAKVVFTGYGDLRFTAYGWAEVGDLSVLGPLGVTRSHIQTSGFATENVGTFATTNIAENVDFQMDITYRRPGNTASEIRVQYAFLEYRPWERTAVRAGRITLPFGWINQHQFYAFQRTSLTPPFYHNGILGLPMADNGVSAAQVFEAGPVDLTVDVFAVNGYGTVPGSTTDFRNASLPGGLSIANNLGRTNNNDKLAYGGRVGVSGEDRPKNQVGASYYYGEWDPLGKEPLQMFSGHLAYDAGPVEGFVEYLNLLVEDDPGFGATVGKPDWRTDGVSAKVALNRISVRSKPVKPWVRFEDYVSRAQGSSTGKEKARSYAFGVTVQTHENVAVKAEASRLEYEVPYSTSELTIDFDTYVLGVAFTF